MTVVQVSPVIDPAIRALCRRPYPGHPRGCPNYGRRSTCPPLAPLFATEFDLSAPVFVVVNEFDLAGHVAKLHETHPDWSDRQFYCCLYWQAGARKQLASQIVAFLRGHRGYRATTCPEAMGVNVTATLAAVGIELEWPPRRIARQVALIGVPRERELSDA